MSLPALDAKRKLFPMRPMKFQDWKKMFQRSSAVHFFFKRTANLRVVNDPQYNAYALLGPQYCPIAYFSVKILHVQ